MNLKSFVKLAVLLFSFMFVSCAEMLIPVALGSDEQVVNFDDGKVVMNVSSNNFISEGDVNISIKELPIVVPGITMGSSVYEIKVEGAAGLFDEIEAWFDVRQFKSSSKGLFP